MPSTKTTLFALLSLTIVALPAHAQRTRCGTPEPDMSGGPEFPPGDCGYSTNNPQPQYDPTFYYDIPVVFHVIQNTAGAGYLSPATIQDQIDVLNEDFQALPGSPGAPGTDARIRFHLATTDPGGSPTTGITYSTNNNWFQDNGSYWNSLAWDTNRYMNVYTNAVPCCYGYVAGFPAQGGLVGQNHDRIVVWWEAVGKDATPGWPLNMGRTATHEAGHYLGLYHTFCGGCGSLSDCYGTADLICDTNRESNSTSRCPGSKSSCGSPDPINNYMDYTDDPCLWEFTPEQVNRMRCTLEHWRPDLSVPVTTAGFNAAPTSGTAPLGVSFTDTSTGTITSWTWDFGDGGTSSAQNPSHTYDLPGAYTVSLDVTGPSGSDNETKTAYVSATKPPQVGTIYGSGTQASLGEPTIAAHSLLTPGSAFYLIGGNLAPGIPSFLAFSQNQLVPPLDLTNGLLLNVNIPLLLLAPAVADAGGEAIVLVSIPAAASGLTVYGQCFAIDGVSGNVYASSKGVEVGLP